MVTLLAVLTLATTACEPTPPPTVTACFHFANGGAWTARPVYLETATSSVATGYPDQQGCVRFNFSGPANDSYRMRVYFPVDSSGTIIGVWYSDTAFTYIGTTGNLQLWTPPVLYFAY